jgi:hypothetical protein
MAAPDGSGDPVHGTNTGRRRWISRGSWRPPVFVRQDSRLIILLFCYSAAVRGLDYATGRDGTAASPSSPLAVIEQAMPLTVWASLLLGAVGVLVVGMVGRWHRPVIVGHVVLAAVYLGLFAGLLPEYLHRDWFDGIRSAGGLAVPVVVHILCAARTRWERHSRMKVRPCAVQ